MARKTRKQPEHPVVSGKTTTFTALGTALGITASGAAQKYYRIKAAYGAVTHIQMQSPYRDPAVHARVTQNLINRELQMVTTHALQHGATHTAMVYNLDHTYVQGLIDQYRAKPQGGL